MSRICVFAGIEPNRHIQASFVEQKQIMEALVERDVMRVEQCVAAHLQASRVRILAQLCSSNGSFSPTATKSR